MSVLKFDLLNNAKDSLTHAVHLLAWPDGPPSNKYKQSILSIFHCAELLLKERLRKVNPALVWSNVDKYPQLSAHTVDVETAIKRLDKIGGVSLSKDERDTLTAARNLRNYIQHFEVDVPEKEAKVMLGKMLAFIFSFSAAQLNVQLDENFKDDDTWMNLVHQFYEFAEQYGPKLSEIMVASGGPVDSCLICGQDTVDMIFERCNLCGMSYQKASDEEQENWSGPA